MSILLIACTKDDESITLNSIKGGSDNIDYVIKNGEDARKGQATFTVDVNEEVISLYSFVGKNELFVKITGYNKVITENDVTITSEKDFIEAKFYSKANLIGEEFKVSNFKLLWTSENKMTVSFKLNDEEYSYSGAWNNSFNVVAFDDVQYEPTLIEKIEGRSTKLTKYVYRIIQSNGEPYERTEGINNTISLAQVDEYLFFYRSNTDRRGLQSEHIYKLKESKIEEKDGKIIVKMGQIPCLNEGCFLFGDEFSSIVNTMYVYNFKMIYDPKTKEFEIECRQGSVQQGAEITWNENDRYIIIKGEWDTTLEPYNEMKPYLTQE